MAVDLVSRDVRVTSSQLERLLAFHRLVVVVVGGGDRGGGWWWLVVVGGGRGG